MGEGWQRHPFAQPGQAAKRKRYSVQPGPAQVNQAKHEPYIMLPGDTPKIKMAALITWQPFTIIKRLLIVLLCVPLRYAP